MEPELISCQVDTSGWRLTVYPLPVAYCIQLFDCSMGMSLIELVATNYRHYGCVDQDHFPKLTTLNELIRLIHDEGDIGIVGFMAEIGDTCRLSVDADDTAIFQFESESSLNGILSKIAKGMGGLFFNTIKSNKGQFIHLTSTGDIIKFQSKKHYLAETAQHYTAPYQ